MMVFLKIGEPPQDEFDFWFKNYGGASPSKKQKKQQITVII
jgi:hypothetical protein